MGGQALWMHQSQRAHRLMPLPPGSRPSGDSAGRLVSGGKSEERGGAWPHSGLSRVGGCSDRGLDRGLHGWLRGWAVGRTEGRNTRPWRQGCCCWSWPWASRCGTATPLPGAIAPGKDGAVPARGANCPGQVAASLRDRATARRGSLSRLDRRSQLCGLTSVSVAAAVLAMTSKTAPASSCWVSPLIWERARVGTGTVICPWAHSFKVACAVIGPACTMRASVKWYAATTGHPFDPPGVSCVVCWPESMPGRARRTSRQTRHHPVHYPLRYGVHHRVHPGSGPRQRLRHHLWQRLRHYLRHHLRLCWDSPACCRRPDPVVSEDCGSDFPWNRPLDPRNRMERAGSGGIAPRRWAG